jgi:hypothetical protein
MLSGKYYVGDLCYVMTDEEWRQVCDIIFKNNNIIDGEFNLPDGRRFAIYSTSWGDGTYYDKEGREYSVDSGSIGCILLSDIKADKYEHIEELGNYIEFENSFVTSEHEGVIQFGTVLIDTDPIFDEDVEYD